MSPLLVKKTFFYMLLVMAIIYVSMKSLAQNRSQKFKLDVRDRVFDTPTQWKPTNTTDLSLEVLKLSHLVPNLTSRPRKFFLDCGANTGSTYKLFREVWPNPEEYYMISFEIDPLLAPYYAGFKNHTALVPLGVSDKFGSFDAFLDDTWQPTSWSLWDYFGRSKVAETSQNAKALKSKWGGGSLFTFSAVGKDEWRGLKRVVQVPTIDFSQFISDNFEITDEVVLKMDIEGAEYAVINKMLNDGTFKYVDKFFLEFHDWQPTGWSNKQKNNLRTRMKENGVTYDKWEAEYPEIPSASNWSPKIVGDLQTVTNKFCPHKSDSRGEIKLVIAIGMSRSKAIRLVESVLAHRSTARINIGLFLYRDFIEDHADLVREWSQNERLILGIRGEGPQPLNYLERIQYDAKLRNILLSSLRQLVKATGFSTNWFLPDFGKNDAYSKELKHLKMNVLKNTVWMPPKDFTALDKAFFEKRTVEQIPPLLEVAHNHLLSKREFAETWLVLDASFDETWISSVFILDYLMSPNAKDKSLVLGSFFNC